MRKGVNKSQRHPQLVQEVEGRTRTSMQPCQELSLGNGPQSLHPEAKKKNHWKILLKTANILRDSTETP